MNGRGISRRICNPISEEMEDAMDLSKFVVFEPQQGSNQFEKYIENDRIYISFHGQFYLSRQLFIEIGSPDYVQVGILGAFYAIIPAEDKLKAYKVQKGDTKSSAPRISCTAFLKQEHLMVQDFIVSYSIRVVDQIILIDRNSKPDIVRVARKQKNKNGKQ